MSLLRVAAPLASLFFFSASAVAQISAPACNSTSWQWTFNSLDQSPCDVTAYMMSTCNLGEYNLVALQKQGDIYVGPKNPIYADLCHCSTVGYSLFSACGACQGADWITWSRWTANCTKTLPPGSFPNPIPSGMRLPHWALIDVTNENYWNPNKSHADTSSPELGPGSILSPSSASNSIAPTSSTSSTTSPVALVGGSSNTGIIVGGAVGGGVAILIAIVAIFYIRQRSRERSAVSSAFQPQRPLSDVGTLATPSFPVAMKFYDLNDSTAFPGHQVEGDPHSPDTASHIGSDSSTLAHSRPSQPQDGGYHGHDHPIV